MMSANFREKMDWTLSWEVFLWSAQVDRLAKIETRSEEIITEDFLRVAVSTPPPPLFTHGALLDTSQ